MIEKFLRNILVECWYLLTGDDLNSVYRSLKTYQLLNTRHVEWIEYLAETYPVLEDEIKEHVKTRIEIL